MSKVQPRDISPILQTLRNILLGRKHTQALRFQDWIAARTQPPPNLPAGSADKLSANHYYTRDGRREVTPPLVLADNSRQAIAAGKETVETAAVQKKPPLPGQVWHWD